MTEIENTESVSSEEYWASLPLEKFLPEMFKRVDTYFETLQEHGMIKLWQDNTNCYYGLNQDSETEGGHAFETVSVNFVDDEGNAVKVRSGHARNIIKHIYLGATGSRLSLSAKASNSDYKSLSQLYAIKVLIDHMLYDQRYETTCNRSTEKSLIFSLAYTFLGISPLDKKIKIRAHSPMTVIKDLSNYSIYDQQWYIEIEKVNKWDIKAKYDVESIEDLANYDMNDEYFVGFQHLYDMPDSDHIYLYHFYHLPTEALPEGRYVAAINTRFALPLGTEDDAFEDDASIRLPYSELPIYPTCPDEMLDSPYGYSVMNQLTGLEAYLNAVMSTIHTHINTFGQKFLAVPMNYKVDTDADTNLTYIRIPEDSRPPTPIDLTGVDKSLFDANELMRKTMETVSAVSSALRGDPQGQTSGSHWAGLYSSSLRFQHGLQQSRTLMIERIATAFIRLVRQNPDNESVIEIIGKDKLPYLRSLIDAEDDIIDRVQVEDQGPMMRTMEGRMQFISALMEWKVINHPSKLMQVIDTGQISELFEESRALTASIQEENERLLNPEVLTVKTDIRKSDRDGMEYEVEYLPELKAIVSDNHEQHIIGHFAQLNTPEVRNNTDMAYKTEIHIKEHTWMWTYGDPRILLATGQKPMPTIEEIMGGGPQNEGPPGPPKPPGQTGPPKPGVMTEDNAPIPKQQGMPQGENIPTMPNMPNMPQAR